MASINFYNVKKREDVPTSTNNSKERGKDGIYRPIPENHGEIYQATIRFLPYYSKETQELINLPITTRRFFLKGLEQGYNGYYDCQDEFLDGKCPLKKALWDLKEAGTKGNGKAKYIFDQISGGRIGNTKYYSYILIIDDKQHPEFNGKVMIYEYSSAINEKILTEFGYVKVDKKMVKDPNAEETDVFDLYYGKDFKIKSKLEKRTSETYNNDNHPNYDSCQFSDSISPIRLLNEKTGKFEKINFEGDEDTKTVTEIDEKDLARLNKLYDSIEYDIYDFKCKEWNDTEKEKVNYVLKYINSIINNKDLSPKFNSNDDNDDDELPQKSPSKNKPNLEEFNDDELEGFLDD